MYFSECRETNNILIPSELCYELHIQCSTILKIIFQLEKVIKLMKYNYKDYIHNSPISDVVSLNNHQNF